MALPEVQVQGVDGGLGIQPDNAAGTHGKVGVCSAGGGSPLVLSGPQEVRDKLGYGPLANACVDSFANGAKTIIAMPAAAGVAGTIGAQVTDPHQGTGSMVASGTPADAFSVLVVILTDGGLNEATFRTSLDGGESWGDALTVPLAGTYAIPNTGLIITFAAGSPDPTGASVSGSAAPWALQDGAQLLFSVNGSPSVNVGIQATPAIVEGSTNGPYTLSEGQYVQVNGETITFVPGPFFVDLAMATPAEVAAFITANAVTFGAEVFDTTKIRLISVAEGADASLNVDVAGTAHAALGLASGAVGGLGNVAEVSAVTFAEMKTLIELASAAVTATEGAGGALTITTNLTGSGQTLQVQLGTHAAFALDLLLHAGSAGGASFQEGDQLAFETTAPAMSVVTATAALTALLAAAYQFEFVHLVGPSTPAMWTIADTLAGAAEDDKRWLHMICEAALPGDETIDEWVADRLGDAIDFQSTRVSVVATPLMLVDALTGGLVGRNGAGVYAGRLSSIPVQRSPGRVADGPVASVLDLAPSDLTEAHIEQLDLAGFITFRRFANTLSAKGVYITLGRMMAGSTSDYKLVQNRRVMDRALWLVREKGLPFLQDEADNGPDDSPGGLARFEATLQTALDAMASAGEIAAGRVIVPEDQNILSTQTVTVSVKVQPRGYMNFIDATVGFENPALAA